ncbi:MAG TPA: hypothetical protein VK036_05450 [Wenzhouxiangella sp.]|nr:hypothetical protein [Wenzhouxiangella sp.]
MNKLPDRCAVKRMFVLLSILPGSRGHAYGAVTALTNRLRRLGMDVSARTIHRDLAFFESLGWAARTRHGDSEERWMTPGALDITPCLRPVTEPPRPPDILLPGEENSAGRETETDGRPAPPGAKTAMKAGREPLEFL